MIIRIFSSRRKKPQLKIPITLFLTRHLHRDLQWKKYRQKNHDILLNTVRVFNNPFRNFYTVKNTFSKHFGDTIFMLIFGAVIALEGPPSHLRTFSPDVLTEFCLTAVSYALLQTHAFETWAMAGPPKKKWGTEAGLERAESCWNFTAGGLLTSDWLRANGWGCVKVTEWVFNVSLTPERCMVQLGSVWNGSVRPRTGQYCLERVSTA